MWVKRSEYLDMVRRDAAQAQSVQWLIARVNQLEKRNALLESKLGVPPIDIPEIVMPLSEKSPHISDKRQRELEDKAPTMRDIMAGNINFEDMGDERARELGIE
jgi:hypothetical protein